MSEGGSKFDFNKIVDNIRQVIPKTSSTPDPVDGDDLGKLMQDISVLSKEAAEKHAELTQMMYVMEEKVNQLYEDMQVVRDGSAEKSVSGSESQSSNGQNDQCPPEDS